MVHRVVSLWGKDFVWSWCRIWSFANNTDGGEKEIGCKLNQKKFHRGISRLSSRLQAHINLVVHTLPPVIVDVEGKLQRLPVWSGRHPVLIARFDFLTYFVSHSQPDT